MGFWPAETESVSLPSLSPDELSRKADEYRDLAPAFYEQLFPLWRASSEAADAAHDAYQQSDQAKGKARESVEEAALARFIETELIPRAESNQHWAARAGKQLDSYAKEHLSAPSAKELQLPGKMAAHDVTTAALKLLAWREGTTERERCTEALTSFFPSMDEFTDLKGMTMDYFRRRELHVEDGVLVLMAVVVNTFYETLMPIMDGLVKEAAANMEKRRSSILGVEDFALQYEVTLRHELPFRARRRTTVVQIPKTPVTEDEDEAEYEEEPTITRSGRQSIPTRAARAAQKEKQEAEKRAREREKKRKEKEKEQEKERIEREQNAQKEEEEGTVREKGADAEMDVDEGGSRPGPSKPRTARKKAANPRRKTKKETSKGEKDAQAEAEVASVPPVQEVELPSTSAQQRGRERGRAASEGGMQGPNMAQNDATDRTVRPKQAPAADDTEARAPERPSGSRDLPKIVIPARGTSRRLLPATASAPQTPALQQPDPPAPAVPVRLTAPILGSPFTQVRASPPGLYPVWPNPPMPSVPIHPSAYTLPPGPTLWPVVLMSAQYPAHISVPLPRSALESVRNVNRPAAPPARGAQAQAVAGPSGLAPVSADTRNASVSSIPSASAGPVDATGSEPAHNGSPQAPLSAPEALARPSRATAGPVPRNGTPTDVSAPAASAAHVQNGPMQPPSSSLAEAPLSPSDVPRLSKKRKLR